jgi:PPOX class probable F420-dependent enzyme
MSLAMSRTEREAFLAETRVGVVGIPEAGRGPLAVPVWYAYEPGGEIRFVTSGESKKARLLRVAGRLTLCVQEETAPYRYVSVEGPATIGRPDLERDIRRTAIRYLGEQMGETYLQATASENDRAVLVTVRPRHWLSADYRKWGG